MEISDLVKEFKPRLDELKTEEETARIEVIDVEMVEAGAGIKRENSDSVREVTLDLDDEDDCIVLDDDSGKGTGAGDTQVDPSTAKPRNDQELIDVGIDETEGAIKKENTIADKDNLVEIQLDIDEAPEINATERNNVQSPDTIIAVEVEKILEASSSKTESALPVITSVASASDRDGLFHTSIKQESLEIVSSSSQEIGSTSSGVKVEISSDESDTEDEDHRPLLMTENNDNLDHTGDQSSDSEKSEDDLDEIQKLLLKDTDFDEEEEEDEMTNLTEDTLSCNELNNSEDDEITNPGEDTATNQENDEVTNEEVEELTNQEVDELINSEDEDEDLSSRGDDTNIIAQSPPSVEEAVQDILIRHRLLEEDLETACTEGSPDKELKYLKLNCLKCPETFVNKEDLRIHMETNHNNQKSENGLLDRQICCKLCYSVFTVKQQLKQHETHIHKNEGDYLSRELSSDDLKFKCNECDLKFVSLHSRIYHKVKTHYADRGLDCTICKKTSETPRGILCHYWRSHKRQIESNENINNLSEGPTSAINEDIDNSGDENSSVNEGTKNKIETTSNRAHGKRDHSEEDYRKETEDESTENQQMRRKRRRKTEGELKTPANILKDQKVDSVCKVCGKLFQWKQSLKQHMKKHDGIKEKEGAVSPTTLGGVLKKALNSGNLMGFMKTL